MSILGSVLGVGEFAGDLINSGTCGKKCYGIGKTLRKCRSRRTADCKRAEQQKAEQRRQAELAEQKILAEKNADYAKPGIATTAVTKAGMSIPQGWAIPAAALALIFFFFNFSQKA